MSSKSPRQNKRGLGRLLDVAMTHAAIIISLMLVVFFVIDRVNKPMGFMTNEFHKRITFALALLCLYLAGRRVGRQIAEGLEEKETKD